MNDSGEAVGEAQRYLKIPEGDIVVFHDEIDLAPGRLKVKAGGGNAGHNGLRSLTAHIGNDYVRVRIGVGHPGHKDAVQHYVLRDFTKADREWLEPLLDAIADASGRLAKGEHARFLSDVALALKAADEPMKSPARPAPRRAPPSEEAEKPQGALARSLRRWLTGGKS
jgi:PTH1 family peptidyl-tRNA hydrolase